MSAETSSSLALLRRIIFLISLPFFILNMLLPIYGKQIGASLVQIGIFFSVFSVMTVILRPLVGWGLDRLGRRMFFIAGVAGYAITMFSFAFIDQIWGVILARIFQGISSSLLWLSANAMIADLAGEQQRGVAFGRITEAGSQGSILGAFVGYFLLNAHISLNFRGAEIGNWMVLFAVYGVVNLAALFLALRGLAETRRAVPKEENIPIRWSQNWITLLLATLVTGASTAMLAPILIIYLQEKMGVGVETIVWAFLPSGLVWALLPAQLGKLADRFGRKPMMLLGLGAAVITSFALPWMGTLVAIAALWAFEAACLAASQPAEQALVADLTGNHERGRGYGLYLMCADLGAAIGPLGGTWLYQNYGAAMPFYANGFILAASALMLLFFMKIPARQAAA